MKTVQMTLTKNKTLGYVWTGPLQPGYSILTIGNLVYFINDNRSLEIRELSNGEKQFLDREVNNLLHLCWKPITNDIQATKILLLGDNYRTYVNSQGFIDDE